MDSPADTPKGVGCPIRTSTDQRPLAAPRGFSQRATSFIASWCQGIHRMPFSRSTHPPCTGTIHAEQHRREHTRRTKGQNKTHTLSNAPEHSRPIRWGAAHATTARTITRSDGNTGRGGGRTPGTTRRTTAPKRRARNRHPEPSRASRDAPEPDSLVQRPHAPPHGDATRTRHTAPYRGRPHRTRTRTTTPTRGRERPYGAATPASKGPNTPRRHTHAPRARSHTRERGGSTHAWRRPGSNRRPPACKAGALPAELRPRTRPRHTRTTGRCGPTVWAREDLNLRPHAYQACALTN